ncbi:MAG: class I SAM-dependent methyltransferase [Pseudonocardia sp.]|nr:class I SAM-dependent methyltransferase [Pseudonocardia sp.]
MEVVDVHSLRKHYVWTGRPWLDTLRERKDEAIRLIGEEQYRVWLVLRWRSKRPDGRTPSTDKPSTDNPPRCGRN